MKRKHFSMRDLLWLTLVVALCAVSVLNYRALLKTETKFDAAAKDNEVLRVQNAAINEQLKRVTEQVANSDDDNIRLALFSGLGGLGPTDVYDPDQPPKNAKISLELTNGSSQEITVPTEYDGRVMRLLARGHWPLALGSRQAQKKFIDVVRVAPGERRTCFSIPLSEIFTYIPPQAGVQLERKWNWSWSAHPNPPPTPIHVEGKLMSQVVLWAELEVNHRTLRTEPIIILIRTTKDD